MKVVRRTKDGIDILEHAMQGVHISEPRGQIVRFHAERGTAGKSPTAKARAPDDTPEEREVIVRMPREPHLVRRRSR
jgi:hypothetical protein